jgi:hypothetical protein
MPFSTHLWDYSQNLNIPKFEDSFHTKTDNTVTVIYKPNISVLYFLNIQPNEIIQNLPINVKVLLNSIF